MWNTPSLEPHSYRNEGRELFIRLSYSNAPLLEKLEVHYVDEHPKLDAGTAAAPVTQPSAPTRARDLAEVIDLGNDGAQLLGYEYLIDIDTVDSKALMGHGKRAVMGEHMEWEAGDLHLSAPGWAVHNHGSREQGFSALTVQDHPLHIAMESLVWQETLKSAILKLGLQKGFETNLGSLRAA